MRDVEYFLEYAFPMSNGITSIGWHQLDQSDKDDLGNAAHKYAEQFKPKWISVKEQNPPTDGTSFFTRNDNQNGILGIAWYGTVHNHWKRPGGGFNGMPESPNFTHFILPPKDEEV